MLNSSEEKKILNTRLKKDNVEEDNVLPKNMYTFHIDNEWYNDDGSVYGHTNKVINKELQEELKHAKMVFDLLIITYLNLYNHNLTSNVCVSS